VAACNALGLFAAGGRLVVVHDVDRWKAADVKAVEAYLGSPSPETTLALVAAEVKADSALAKVCARSGEVLRYDVPKRDLSRWVAEQFARVGAHADVEACRALVEMSGDDLQALSSEVEKLATWAAGAQIAATDVEALVSVGGETPPWGLTDAWGRRDARAALLATEGLLRDKTIPALVGTLASHVRRVRACALLDADGVRARDAAPRLKMHPFVAEKAYAQARNFSNAELESAIVELARLDLATKGGTRLPDDLELERSIVVITESRHR